VGLAGPSGPPKSITDIDTPMTGSDVAESIVAGPSAQKRIKGQRSLPSIITGRSSPYGVRPSPSPRSRGHTPRTERHPQFEEYLHEVLGGIQDWQSQAEEHVGINLRTLSQDQQQLYQALLNLNKEYQAMGSIAEETAEQYWEELQGLRHHMRNQQEDRDRQIAEALQEERNSRENQGQELAGHLTDTRSMVEAFVKDRLPHIIHQRVQEALQVERMKVPKTYSKKELDYLIQKAVNEALEATSHESRESTPRGPPQDPEPNAPPPEPKGKNPAGPPAPPPNAPGRPNASPSPSPSPEPSPQPNAKGKKGEKFYFSIQAPNQTPRPRRREATEPWRYSADKKEDLRAWIMACEDYFARNPWEWTDEKDKIKYALGRTKEKTQAQLFGIQYRREMEGSDGFILRPAHRYWHTFVSTIKKRFLSSQEAQEALHQMNAEKYAGDIEDFIMRIKTLNNLVHMSGIPLRYTIEKQLTRTMRHRLSQFPDLDLDQDWIDAVVTVGKKEESFEAEEKLLKGFKEEAKPTKQIKKEAFVHEASKWKAVKTEPAKKKGKRGPKDKDNLTEAEKEEKERLLKGISAELRSSRYLERVCIRCGIKGHGQYDCPAPKPVISSATLKRKRSEEPELKTEPATKKVAGLKTGAGRIWEITGSDEEMEE